MVAIPTTMQTFLTVWRAELNVATETVEARSSTWRKDNFGRWLLTTTPDQLWGHRTLWHDVPPGDPTRADAIRAMAAAYIDDAEYLRGLARTLDNDLRALKNALAKLPKGEFIR